MYPKQQMCPKMAQPYMCKMGQRFYVSCLLLLSSSSSPPPLRPPPPPRRPPPRRPPRPPRPSTPFFIFFPFFRDWTFRSSKRWNKGVCVFNKNFSGKGFCQIECTDLPDNMPEDTKELPDGMPEDLPIICQKICQIGQMECQKICQNICQKICQKIKNICQKIDGATDRMHLGQCHSSGIGHFGHQNVERKGVCFNKNFSEKGFFTTK